MVPIVAHVLTASALDRIANIHRKFLLILLFFFLCRSFPHYRCPFCSVQISCSPSFHIHTFSRSIRHHPITLIQFPRTYKHFRIYFCAFQQLRFWRIRLSASCQTPNLEDLASISWYALLAGLTNCWGISQPCTCRTHWAPLPTPDRLGWPYRYGKLPPARGPALLDRAVPPSPKDLT